MAGPGICLEKQSSRIEQNSPPTALNAGDITSKNLNTPDIPHSSNPESKAPQTSNQLRWTRLLTALSWTPPWCRWDEQNPPKFGLPLNFLFAFAGTFTVS